MAPDILYACTQRSPLGLNRGLACVDEPVPMTTATNLVIRPGFQSLLVPLMSGLTALGEEALPTAVFLAVHQAPA